MRILFTGGGSGGHIFPIIALARELKEIAETQRILDLELYYMGPDDFGRGVLEDEDIIGIYIRSGKMRRYASLANVADVFRTGLAVMRAIWRMFFIMPDVIFSKGGYGALPAVVAGIIFRIPIMIHESDAVPGRVNVFSARFATRIGISFASAALAFPKQKTALVGVPIRKRILGGNREHARENLDIFSELPVVGFIGASQGAEPLNNAVTGILKEMTSEIEVLHQTGKNNIEGVREEATVILENAHKERYHAFGFLDEGEMQDFYAVSELIVSRAGASSLFEIAALGKPSIVIPLLHAAQDHQRKNAYEYASYGACVVIEQANLTPHVLFAEVKKLLGSSEKLKKMAEAAQSFSRIDAGSAIAGEILKLGVHE